MSSAAYCAYCFESVAAFLERRKPLSFSDTLTLWNRYQCSDIEANEDDVLLSDISLCDDSDSTSGSEELIIPTTTTTATDNHNGNNGNDKFDNVEKPCDKAQNVFHSENLTLDKKSTAGAEENVSDNNKQGKKGHESTGSEIAKSKATSTCDNYERNSKGERSNTLSVNASANVRANAISSRPKPPPTPPTSISDNSKLRSEHGANFDGILRECSICNSKICDNPECANTHCNGLTSQRDQSATTKVSSPGVGNSAQNIYHTAKSNVNFYSSTGDSKQSDLDMSGLSGDVYDSVAGRIGQHTCEDMQSDNSTFDDQDQTRINRVAASFHTFDNVNHAGSGINKKDSLGNWSDDKFSEQVEDEYESCSSSSGMLSDIVQSVQRKSAKCENIDGGAAKYPFFVTWNTVIRGKHRALRGCIGTFEPTSLNTGLRIYALSSAFNDTRFSPIMLSELPSLECSVSLLVAFEKCRDAFDWEIGEHGLRISFTHKDRTYHGLYLPEVAVEQGWNKEKTLINLMRKAGWNGWTRDWLSIVNNVSTELVRYRSSKVSLTHGEWQAWRKELKNVSNNNSNGGSGGGGGGEEDHPSSSGDSVSSPGEASASDRSQEERKQDDIVKRTM